MKTIVGIDLGTTFSLVAAIEAGEPRVLPNALGEFLTPSAVSVAEDGSVLVGAPARARATTHPLATAVAFKRDMGTERIFDLNGRKMTPQELSALVLGSLKRDAEAALGRPIDEAVVTVPAYFGDAQRQATRDAAAIAELHVERIINEPTAAALAYGLHNRSREMRAAVLDLGGGTFDVTVLEIIEGVIEIHSSAGDARLGGEDFDGALADAVAADILGRERFDPRADPRSRARLRAACEEAKRRLSQAESARIALVDLPAVGGKTVAIERTITRDEAEGLWAPLLDRVRAPVLRALRDAKVSPQDVDEVLLVGGSTRMPCIARLAAQIFGKIPLRFLPPDEAIALGAAVQAALKANDSAVRDLVATDVAPFTLGIQVSQQLGTARVPGIFAPILERGTVIPASRVRRFSTVADLQRFIKIEIYQGEHSQCSDNQKLGEYKAEGIPPAAAGEESVDVRFTYDLNGILEVETEIVTTKKKQSLVVERTPGRLSAAEIEKARQAMTRLKIHPRDLLPNTTALARADALFVELSGDERALLGQTIAAMRAAIEAQEGQAIEVMRGRVNALIQALKRG